ncbi:hypothetical protein JAB5_53970 [Janthinobacterium sp. HH103]|uniref:DNA uptake protein n=1 Tax=unclassified Janthinobacterium TaxID=2610881 RepID=UPI000892C047|nr:MULTISPECIES: DNA uptake protein [unclassified Janthinobacterium]OEZ67456.1 hypothetical protein JAB5_53970 [Janthinobacterium sp. HH103]OEZ67838.1 hypothetical protein JAB2_20750 [Janthinobacterium sp. HH100]QOU72223.1 hypothetical protein JAB4_016470 [Janthinobacterium sp. HH102]
MTQKDEALRLIDGCLKDLESQKGSLLSGIQKLARASTLIERSDVVAWCAIQLGDPRYTRILKELLDFYTDKTIDKKSVESTKKYNDIIEKLTNLNLTRKIHYRNEELNIKATESGGGYVNIGFIEERYADLVRMKIGNDSVYYKNNLQDHINYVKRIAHSFASEIFNELKFSGTVKNCFDILKNAVDDKLLDLNPALTEQLMQAFKSVASSKEEEWSQALTTCRRLIETLADALYPPSDKKHNGRALGPTNYVNRLWAFMDQSIPSDTNKDLAKVHVDFLGAWLEKVNKISNKGVHAKVSQIEATKAVFHMYLVVADILEIQNSTASSPGKKNINDATIDEIEVQLNVNRAVAKEIYKLRITFGKITSKNLSSIKGMGQKTIEKACSIFEISD